MKRFLSEWFCRIFWHRGVVCNWQRSEQGGAISVMGFCVVCTRCGEMLNAHPAAPPVKPDVDDSEDGEE